MKHETHLLISTARWTIPSPVVQHLLVVHLHGWLGTRATHPTLVFIIKTCRHEGHVPTCPHQKLARQSIEIDSPLKSFAQLHWSQVWPLNRHSLSAARRLVEGTKVTPSCNDAVVEIDGFLQLEPTSTSILHLSTV